MLTESPELNFEQRAPRRYAKRVVKVRGKGSSSNVEHSSVVEVKRSWMTRPVALRDNVTGYLVYIVGVEDGMRSGDDVITVKNGRIIIFCLFEFLGRRRNSGGFSKNLGPCYGAAAW